MIRLRTYLLPDSPPYTADGGRTCSPKNPSEHAINTIYDRSAPPFADQAYGPFSGLSTCVQHEDRGCIHVYGQPRPCLWAGFSASWKPLAPIEQPPSTRWLERPVTDSSDPASDIVTAAHQRYPRVFPPEIDSDNLPFSHTFDPFRFLPILFQRRW